jgi:putative hemolysin
MNSLIEPLRLLVQAPAHYRVGLAADSTKVRDAQALRFEVFNLELHEGLAESYATGLDVDQFDPFCDHLIVEHLPTSRVIGTYRMQTGTAAAKHLGYYSAQEFEFGPFEGFRGQIVELGRACIHREHRNLVVLGLLWKGIADYCRRDGARYLLGCSSITSQDSAVGASVYADLCRKQLAPPPWRTAPRAEFECPLGRLAETPQKIPKLLRAYLGIGARICGPPALDRQFKTIDFLTLLDLDTLPLLVRERFLG